MIVWCNGCFDVLHKGHIELLKYAKSLGGELVVGIDSDEKVRKDKGETRPFFNQEDRKTLLLELKSVDKVFIFNSPEQLEDLIRTIRPDIMVVGSDWENKAVIGSQYVKEVKYFKRLDKYSTTKILKYGFISGEYE